MERSATETPPVGSTPSRETCAVIGAGLGGCALVASMALAGYRMRLHDLDDGRLDGDSRPRRLRRRPACSRGSPPWSA